jgi:hypothetical protein
MVLVMQILPGLGSNNKVVATPLPHQRKANATARIKTPQFRHEIEDDAWLLTDLRRSWSTMAGFSSILPQIHRRDFSVDLKPTKLPTLRWPQ